MTHHSSNLNRLQDRPATMPPPPPPEAPPVEDPRAGPPPPLDTESAPRPGARRGRLRSVTSVLISSVTHALLLLALGLLIGSPPAAQSLSLIAVPAAQDSLRLGDAGDVLIGAAGMPTPDASRLPTPALAEWVPAPAPPRPASAQPDRPLDQLARVLQRPRDLAVRGRSPDAGSWRGRSGDRRGELLGERGGNPQSENAVALGLAWLAAHQHRDGGWRFDLNMESGPCRGQCRDAGTVGSTTAASGLALLAFLGAGQTHLEGEYRDVVHDGIYYLKRRARATGHGADLQEGTMYAQGIATLALCEAYGMTRDESLGQVTQQAIDFICYAQHSAGGWRYYPHQPGDTTVFGWQMMALKSAAMAGLDVPSPVLRLAERFLDSVQTEYGAYYGYVGPDKLPGPTAIGLLIRMYTGWGRDDSRLGRGVRWLAELGPSQSDMYFNYYATLVLCQYNGPSWPTWNTQLRDYLIRTQATDGHERGSWFFADKHGNQAGRMYTTAMCVMILEVYYRYLPLYESEALRFDF